MYTFAPVHDLKTVQYFPLVDRKLLAYGAAAALTLLALIVGIAATA